MEGALTVTYRQRHRGTTTQRGYGSTHIHRLNAERAAWTPGQPCAQCRHPIWCLYVPNPRDPKRWISVVDLGHTPDRTGYIGLCHRYCNRAEGAIRGNRGRGQASGWGPSRRW